MESPRSQVRMLLNNRYVALGIVILCAFIVAFVTALISRDRGSTTTQIDPLTTKQSGTQPASSTTTTDATGYDQTSSSTQNAPSLFERIAQVFQKDGPSSDVATSTKTTSRPTKSGQTSTSPNQPTSSDNEAPYIPELRQAQKLPTISIQKYTLTTQLPQKPTSPRIYELKTSYTDADVDDQARALGFELIDAREKGGSIQKVYDLKNNQYLGFDMQSGHFTFYSENGVPITGLTSSPVTTALNVLKSAGLADPYLVYTATYQRKDDSTRALYVEFHRDWKAIGAPIMNPLGLLNLTQKDSIDSVSLGWQSPFAFPDGQIINTSDGYDELTRPDSFNTITVALSMKDKKVYEVASTMPRIIQSETLDDSMIISPIEAYNTYIQGTSILGITGPAGDGNVLLPDVYSNGLASAKSVDVTDFELMYPESSEMKRSQWWCPVYALRSFGKVQTGFDVQFAHIVPASRDPRCLSKVLGTSNSRTLAQAPFVSTIPSVAPTVIPEVDTSSLKYGTFEFKVEAVPDSQSNDCPTDFNHSYIFNETPDVIDYVAWIDRSVSYPNGTKRRPLASRRIEGPDRTWYFVRKIKAGAQPQLTSLNPTYTGAQLLNFRLRAYDRASQGEPAVAPLDPRFNGLDTVFCQFIVTGSPWIHVYAPSPTEVTILPQPLGGVAYANPSLDAGNWTVSADQSGKLVFADNSVKDALHWEYTSAPVQNALKNYLSTHPHHRSTGYSIPSELRHVFIEQRAREMGLTPSEILMLKNELNRPTLAINTPYVTISFASEEFLTSVLPIKIHPRPQSLSRVFFVLEEKLTYENLTPPQLPTISRAGLTVVETGFIKL